MKQMDDYISRKALLAGLRDYQKQCREHWMGPRMDDIIALVKAMPDAQYYHKPGRSTS